jgi:DNA repair protein RecO (recombination protein O)
VVLRRHDLGETDRIVTLYTAHLGKVKAVAKGVRRPTSKLGGHLELFTRSQLMLARGRNLDVITQVETIDAYRGLRDDLWRAGLAYYAAELVDRLTEERAENEALYTLLTTTLGRIADSRRPDHATHVFELGALSVLGFHPELAVCAACRAPLQPIENGFSSAAGGVVCATCRPHEAAARRLSANALKMLRLYLNGSWPTIERVKLEEGLVEEIDQLLRAHVQYIAESQLKSAGFVAALRREGLVKSGAGPR